MAEVTYDKQLTALLVIDPYNDFISEGGKVWDRLRSVAEANGCVPNMLQVLNAAHRAELRVSMRCIIGTVQATTRPGSTLLRFRRQLGRIRPSKTARGVARSAANSNRNRAISWRSSIGVPVALPTPIWICSSTGMAFTSSSSSGS
jgi:hypothetical protein